MPRIWLLCCISLLVGQSSKPYHPTRDRYFDVQHIVIDLQVDLQDRSISGRVTHTLSPLSDSLSLLSLDATGLEIHQVSLGTTELSFDQDEDRLWIELDRIYGFEDTLDVTITYFARPKRGLFFIQPDSAYPNKHVQAWTQGEDMDNHYWVPLYDYPNDKATFEVILTVPKPYMAISNGELVGVREESDTRTFHWRENWPMSSYLISFAVGEYRKIEDHYGDLPVNYWVYPEHSRADALRSFGRTPDILAFYNDLTGYPYPYEKYDQVIIEDFMYGGMENVTLTHQTDRTMHTERARPDHTSDGLVAHELAHQWYGNLLTTRNWANAWLNEGFASFLTYLWVEHDLGKDEAEYVRYRQLQGVIWADRSRRRPVVQYEYDDSMELFDANIYAKGSVILNMLRTILGEEAFRRALQFYTRTYAFQNVETQDLKRAIEEVTGQNLYWFFDQWVYRGGLPEYRVEYRYNRRRESLTLTVTQTQDLEQNSLFRMPVTILVDDGELNRRRIWVEDRETTVTIPCRRTPKMVIFDEGQIIPKRLDFEKTERELIYQMQHAPHVLDRIWAMNELGKGTSSRKVIAALNEALRYDPFWGVRVKAAETIGKLHPKNGAELLLAAGEGQDNRVLRACIRALAKYPEPAVRDYLLEVLSTSQKDYTLADAYQSLTKVDTAAADSLFAWAMEQDIHEDLLRKTAIRFLGTVQTDAHFRRLLKLARYGQTTYEARPGVFQALGNTIDSRPEILDTLAVYLADPDLDVRRACIDQLARHGRGEQMKLLKQMLPEDPVNEMRLKRAIREIQERIAAEKEQRSKGELRQELNTLKRKLEKIRSILND
jgi:aminopeptidase N